MGVLNEKRCKKPITLSQHFDYNRDLLRQLSQPTLKPQHGLVRKLKTQKRKLNMTKLGELRDEREIKQVLSDLTRRGNFERSYLINTLFFRFGIERIILFDMGCNDFEETNKSIVQTQQQKQIKVRPLLH